MGQRKEHPRPSPQNNQNHAMSEPTPEIRSDTDILRSAIHSFSEKLTAAAKTIADLERSLKASEEIAATLRGALADVIFSIHMPDGRQVPYPAKDEIVPLLLLGGRPVTNA